MKNNKGFTLIELLIVVAIIGIIAAIAIPSLLRARVSANEAQAIGDSRSVISAEQTYASANGGYFGPIANLCSLGVGCWGQLQERHCAHSRLGNRGGGPIHHGHRTGPGHPRRTGKGGFGPRRD